MFGSLLQEQSWTHDVLRKISPNEADLLNDPSVNAKIRFRFAGQEFPPVILFKIFLISNGTKYISGRRTIRPSTDVSLKICVIMRTFYIVEKQLYYKNSFLLNRMTACA